MMWYLLHPNTFKVLAESATKKGIVRKAHRFCRKEFDLHTILVEYREDGKQVKM